MGSRLDVIPYVLFQTRSVCLTIARDKMYPLNAKQVLNRYSTFLGRTVCKASAGA